MTYFEAGGKHYVIWAQHNEAENFLPLYGTDQPAEPWKIITKPMLLTTPEYDWEKVRYAVNEGPAVLKHDGKIFVCFSCFGNRTGVLCRCAGSGRKCGLA